jgi:hypothetical protein
MLMEPDELDLGDDELEEEEKEDSLDDEDAEPDADLLAEDSDDDGDGAKKKKPVKARKKGETDALDGEDREVLNEPLEQHFSCPHCGESISVILDPDGAEDGTEIEEDCEVCCRTMSIGYRVEDGLVVEFNVEAV